MSINPTEYTVSLLPYSNLRYDRQNPRVYPDEQYEDPIQLATHLIEHFTGTHTESYVDCIDNTALRPYIVVKEEENVYTVLDGNIRLSVIHLTMDKVLRKKVRMNKKPALSKANDHFLWCAVFPDRQTAMPHIIRSGTNNNARTWSLDGWARIMKDALVQGYTLEDVAKFSEYRVDGLARLLESHNAFNQLNRIHNNRWSGIYRTSYMREALDKYYIRQAIGLPEKPGTVDNLDPLPQTKIYTPVQIELMNWLFGS